MGRVINSFKPRSNFTFRLFVVDLSNQERLILCEELFSTSKDFELPSLNVDLYQVRDQTTLRNKVIQADRCDTDKVTISKHGTGYTSLYSPMRLVPSALSKGDIRR